MIKNSLQIVISESSQLRAAAAMMPAIGKCSLQSAALFSARAFRHHALASRPLLSVKTMFNGTALYRVERDWFAVDESGYLILNDQQPYEIQIDSPTQIESFIVYFPRGWADEVLRGLASPAERLLDEPNAESSKAVHFFERFTTNDCLVAPAIADLRRKQQSGPLPDLLVEEKLRELLARMFRAQALLGSEINAIPAQRPATRQELWRRLNRARDFIRAHLHRPLTLAEISAVACLSPFHCLRGFKGLFHATPHDFLSECRVERAQFLLERSAMPVTDICFSVGFESLGSFSSWFRKLSGMSPRQWRSRSKKQF